MTRRKLIVVSGTNFLRAYSGILYLSQSLSAEGIEVIVYAPIPRSMLGEMGGSQVVVQSLYSPWYGCIPRVRVYAFRAHIVARCLWERNAALLFTELSFFREAVLIKKLRPQIPLIHYCQELLTPEEFPHMRGAFFYARNANVPDLIVDVEPHRAAARKERFKISRKIVVLPNTLPASAFPKQAPSGSLSKLAGGGIPADVPILLYIGGVHKGTGFRTVLDALVRLQRPCFFLGFCHGPSREAVEGLRMEVDSRLGARRGRVCHAVSRLDLLSSIHEAYAGLVYYPYSDLPSVNQRYCAPTKLFEYLAAGLPVIGSANPPLEELLEGRGLGICAKDDSAGGLRRAIEEILECSEAWSAIRDRARQIFARELCFEKAATPVLDDITALIANGEH